jgi:tetratricopeptide (TPR) repeat protein
VQQAVQRGERGATVEKAGVNLLALVFAAATASAPVHFAVSTSNPQAQAAIDRGLFLYYAYDGTDAAQAFAQAAELDPKLAMADWGEALAAGPDLNTPLTEDRFARASAAIRKASGLATDLPPEERRFVEIMALRFAGSFANWTADDKAYREAMFAFAQTSHDVNARLLAAEALLEHGGLAWQNGTPAAEESRDALSIVQGVLKDDPVNVMANHLCIHLYDLAPDRTPALACAKRLDADIFPPQAEHLAHMPAHYWIETGNYPAALRSSERAYELLTQLTSGTDHPEQYAKHDVAVGYSAAMMLGDYAVAQRWSRRMSAAFGTTFDGLTALRFGRYETAYATDGAEFAATSVRGLAALHLGHVDEARALAAKMPVASTAQGYMPQLFLARLAETEGNYTEAQRWIERSVENERAAFGGELIPFFPAGEALGALYLRRNDAAGAIGAYTDALAAYPNDPRALFGLSKALAASGQGAQAAASRTRFEKEWKGADTNVEDALP